MKRLEIELPDDVYHWLEVRAAIDDERTGEGVTRLLCYLVREWEKRRG